MRAQRDALLFSEREGREEGAAEESVPGNSWKLKLRERGREGGNILCGLSYVV